MTDASVLITGGTGSFGTCFVKTLLDRTNVRRIVIYSRDELKQYELEMSLRDHPNFNRLRFFIGDIRDEARLTMAFQGVDTVIHAAALKQVVAAEYNPFECVKTNIFGAENIVRAALANNVEKVVALSTDKAVNPANLYGATKLASDKIFVAANNLTGKAKTKFSVVRYGNVINSRGSVLPLFQKLIASNEGYFPITHKDMTRFWITLEQGVQMVLSTLESSVGGEILIPKIPSMAIIDLAKAMAPDYEHRFIGIRPGEKIHETMVAQEDTRTTLELEDRYVILPQSNFNRSHNADCFYTKNGKVVDDEFIYSSDRNLDWLDVETLKKMLGKAL